MKILIAEDNVVNRELLRELLELRGHEISEASNGQEAVAMLEQSLPDLLIIDLGMPALDGFGAIKLIRSNPRVAGLPVLAATAYAMRGDRERVLDSGFDGYVSKPISPDALEKEMERLVGSSASRTIH